MTFLKNYTSDVPVHQTIYRIEQVLIKCGAIGITKEYTNTAGEISAISFQIEAPTGKLTVRLPADKDKALDALWNNYVDGDKLNAKGDALEWSYGVRKKKTRKDFAAQAERTAWKIMQDWVEVQMSMIQMKQADTVQVFLSHIVVNDNQTVYEKIKQSGYRALLPETTT